MNTDLFSNQEFKQQFKLPDGDVSLIENFYPTATADELFLKLKNHIAWNQDQITIYGKTHDLPRLTAWYGDKGISYSYSKIKMTANGWTKELEAVKKIIEKTMNTKFNSCLLNYYRGGEDSMGWHQDNEMALGKNPIIASLTFGATRSFQLKHIEDKSLKTIDIPLKHGSLLIMKGSTQHFWKHQVPKTKKTVNERINLTFRQIF